MKNFRDENKLNNFFFRENNKPKVGMEKITYYCKNKNVNLKEQKKILFNDINDDNSYSIKESLNKNIINIDNNRINITIEQSSLFSDLKNIYGNTVNKNEYVFNSLNSSIITNFSLSKTENESQNQMQNDSINKKSLKRNEATKLNINSIINIDSTKRPILKCNCKNSNCLKCYCECFANGRFCDNCICKNCKNTKENKELRQQKYKNIISRNPKAIQKINATKRSWTCNCINSNCSKKYCDCYHNGRFCTSKCKCVNCLNKNNGINNYYNQKKIKRIRGINNKKLNKIIQKRIKKNKIIINNENINSNENSNYEGNIIINESAKKLKTPLIKYYTPQKAKICDDNNDNYYQNETTTIGLTGEKKKKNI